MRKDGILNPALETAIASVGHTEYLAIGDCGLPMPAEAKILDLSLVRGIPTFLQVLEAVKEELVIESFIYAEEADTLNPSFVEAVKQMLPDIPFRKLSHEEFKKETRKARTVIRTGEYTAYANIILVGGTNF